MGIVRPHGLPGLLSSIEYRNSPVYEGELDDLWKVLGSILAQEGPDGAVAKKMRADLLEPRRLFHSHNSDTVVY